MKILIQNKIVGTRIYSTIGDYKLSNDYSEYKEDKNFEYGFNGNEEIQVTKDGLLLVYSCEGDEQPSSDFMIMKDWEIVHIEYDIPKCQDAVDYVSSLFYYSNKGKMSNKLKSILAELNTTI